jgi:hypothetical protein
MCNSSQYYSSITENCLFPYSTSQVNDHFQNVNGKKQAAYSFYTGHMEHGW